MSIYQTMYYVMHNGNNKTPLHMMTAHNVYDTCKSRELITSLNSIGVSVSYNEVRKARSRLAKYAFTKSQTDDIPMPSHFVTDRFTIAAFDNFDSADKSSPTGTLSSHDTALVLFQIKPDDVPAKPLISTMDLANAVTCESKKLKCQHLLDYK